MEITERERRASIIERDFDGIISSNEAFYIHSIIYSASQCLEAFNRYQSIKKEQDNLEQLISKIQEAVGHAAALSRYFWPSEQSKRKQTMLKQLK